MTDTEEHGFKPALLRGRHLVDVGETHLVFREARGGEKWRLAWADISSAAFVDYKVRGARMSRLDFLSKDGKPMRSVSCNSTAINPMADPEFLAYRATVAAITERLSRVSPNLPVTVGEYGRTAMWIFGIGIASIIFSLGIAIAALAGGRGEALVPVSVLLIFGLYLAWSNAPWRPRLSVPVKLFAKTFSGLDEAANRQ